MLELSASKSIPALCDSSGHNGAGWVNISYPTGNPTFISRDSFIYLTGEAFISPTWWHCCNGTASELTAVRVTCRNCTKGVLQQAYQTVNTWPYLNGHKWSCSVDLLEGDNFIEVTARDPSGNWGRDVIKVKSTAPHPPSSLTSKATSSSTIALGWKDNSKNEAGFRIERKAGACGSLNSWARIATKATNEKTHTNSGLTANTTYSYRVQAYNAGGNSAYSNCASAKTAFAGTPAAPTKLNAQSISENQIKLTWTDNSTNEMNFKIYRKAGSGLWSLLATKDADVVSHIDATVAGNTSTRTYSFYIYACNSNGCSPSTNVAVVPYKPTTLSATVSSSSRINITWADKSNNETGFQIYRKAGACSSSTAWSLLTIKAANSTSHSDTGLTSGRTYSYRVWTFTKSLAIPYAYGFSLSSNCRSATTP